MVFNKETEEIGQVNETFELVHVMFKVFLSGGILPIIDGLRAEPEDFFDTIQFAERVEDIHFGNVSKVLLT